MQLLVRNADAWDEIGMVSPDLSVAVLVVNALDLPEAAEIGSICLFNTTRAPARLFCHTLYLLPFDNTVRADKHRHILIVAMRVLWILSCVEQ
jgi:hypothetical protein